MSLKLPMDHKRKKGEKDVNNNEVENSEISEAMDQQWRSNDGMIRENR